MNPQLRKLVKDELSGETAKAYVQQITRFHRIQASTMYHEAAEYVKQQLLDIGLKDAKIEQFPSDGAIQYWTYTAPVGWEIKSAELKLIEPRQEILARYADTPTSVHTLSNATPPGGVTAELIDVGAGIKAKDYEGKNVRDKIVLATGRARAVHEQAVYKRGAAGVITDTLAYEMTDVRESVDIPDAHSYQSIWPTAEDQPKVKFGFSISKRQGTHLRELLKANGTVKLHAKIDARLFPGNLDVVTATIGGSTKPDEEVFLIAHLCHPQPSANDNASGSGLQLEIARTIQTLISTKKMRRPQRTIRFMWVPETYGTVAFLHNHQDWPKRLIAGIDLDMVGENQELCKSTLTIDRTPDSLPSYLNDLLLALTEQSTKEFDKVTQFGSSSTFRHLVNAHSGGSDHHEFVDSTIRVPCVMLLQWPDTFYHTSMDTIDKVSTDSLKRVGWITVVAALTLANATVDETILLAQQTHSRGITRIHEAQREALQALHDSRSNTSSKTEQIKALTKTHQQFKNKIQHVTKREKQAVSSVQRLGTSAEIKRLIRELNKEIDAVGSQALTRLQETIGHIAKTVHAKLPAETKDSQAEKQARQIVPKRRFKGTLSADTFRRRLGIEEFRWYEEIVEKDIHFTKKRAEIINYMDGKRNLYDIVQAVSAEYDETNMEHALKFIKDLEKTKFISISPRETPRAR